MKTLRIHVHDNKNPKAQDCIAEADLQPLQFIQLHFHAGECTPCAKGHCHQSSLVLCLTEDGELYLCLEGISRPGIITHGEQRAHGFERPLHPPAEAQSGEPKAKAADLATLKLLDWPLPERGN